MEVSNSPRSHHSRSSSISKNLRTHSHQRKPSINSNSLYPIDEQRSSPFSNTSSWQQLFHKQDSSFDMNDTGKHNGPLLPHDKQALAFGGSARPSWYQTLWKSIVFRFFAILYVTFSIFLSLQHLWTWWHISPVDDRFGEGWIPQRTYDQDLSYSVMDEMTHGLTMSKLFAKTNYQTARGVQPHWLTASQTPDQEAITAVTVVTLDTWKDLERLTQQWKGPLSVTVHIPDDLDSKSKVKELYNSNPAMMERMDIHLSPAPQPGISVLVPRNAERNLARMFARSDYIMELPSNVLPVTDLQHTMVTNKEMFTTLLRNGDVLVIPTFGFTDQQESQYRLPSSKASVLTMLERDQIYMIDKHWKPNAGPTDVDHWKSATTLYPVDRYDFHYEPIVIQSKTVQPYCPERFLDSRSACLFASYLGGNEFWVLPDDYAVELPAMEKSILSDFDHVIENRLYAKFYWEQCVHQARQLDSLGLWKGKRSEHIRTQCSRVIQNWGKGLIGKPE